jgi:hypothetical protein
MLDRLTFSWFVGTCNLAHPATGPQEALWNTVKHSYFDLYTPQGMDWTRVCSYTRPHAHTS